jgi:hypothetical protein
MKPHSNETMSLDTTIIDDMPLNNVAMQEEEASTKEALALFSTAESPSENEVTITTTAVHDPPRLNARLSLNSSYIICACCHGT